MSLRTRAAYGGLVAVYAATRLSLLWRFPPHVDESLFAQWTLDGYQSVDSRFQALASGQHPMLEWMGMGLMRLGAEPLTAVRLVSMLAGVVTLGLTGHLGAQLGGHRVGLVAAALWVVLPFGLVYSVIGLYDPLTTALVLAAAVIQLHLARRPRLDLALVLGIVLGVGLLTKLTVLSAFWLMPLGVLVFDWRADGRWGRLVRWLGGLALAAAMAWILFQLLQLSDLANDLPLARKRLLADHSVSAFLDHPLRWIDGNWPSYQSALLGYLTVPGLLLLAAGAGVIVFRGRRTGLYILGWGVLPIVAVTGLADIPYVRWLLVAVPPLLVAAALGLVEIAGVARRAVARWVSGRLLALAVPGLAALLLVPAVVWDATTIATPATRPYPGHDDLDYVTAYSGGGPWLRLVPELRRRAAGNELVVAYSGPGTYYVQLALRHDREITLVAAGTSGDAGALVGFGNGQALPQGPSPLVWTHVRTYARPRGGVPVDLYERGVRDGAATAVTPDVLRRIVGGVDADFDAYVRAHPAVKPWLDAWARAQPS